MSWDSKVLWTEGLFLQPQHFQQADRHVDARVAGLAQRMLPYGWGFSDLVLDESALKIGQFALRSASGLTQDGAVFRIPQTDDHPPALQVPVTIKDCVVLLTVPARREGAQEVDLSGTDEAVTRLQPAEQEVVDTMGRQKKPATIGVGKLRLRYGLAVDDLAGKLAIPIARIIEVRPDREIIMDRAFMPTVIDLRACEPLSGFLEELEGLMIHRMTALAGRLAEGGAARGVAEVQDVLLLQILNRAIPLVRHLRQIENLHPETAFRACIMLAGELATFLSGDKRAPDFPPYTHHDPVSAWSAVIRHLRRFLSSVLEQNAVAIPLEERKYGISVGVIADRRLIGSSGFVLAVAADIPSEDVRRHFAGQTKLGPVEEIRQLVNSALPGIALRPLPVAPRQIPYHAGVVYFELDQSNPAWKRMSTSGGIAVHVSGQYPGLKMELWAIRTS